MSLQCSAQCTSVAFNTPFGLACAVRFMLSVFSKHLLLLLLLENLLLLLIIMIVLQFVCNDGEYGVRGNHLQQALSRVTVGKPQRGDPRWKQQPPHIGRQRSGQISPVVHCCGANCTAASCISFPWLAGPEHAAERFRSP